jgi:Na+/H+ antiporter NhaD/arsenite permease-like protein
MGKLLKIFRREPVLWIAAICAALTAIAVPPDTGYIDYVDLRVLGLLWSLMAVVAGLRKLGAFEALTFSLMMRRHGGGRGLSVLLVALPFFAAMAVTNDVALLTFVPFTLELLETAGQSRAMIPILTLQTVAANLGSMATPVGNPQNLYLYAFYDLSAGDFFRALLPLTALSLVLLTAAALPILPKTLAVPQLDRPQPIPRGRLALHAGLFALCLLSVFRVLPWWALTVVILTAFLLTDREVLKRPDYALLATFVFFFIVSGNLGRMGIVHAALQALLRSSTLLTAVLTSQVISNVPAAVLLSGFTADWRGLLLGVDIGGLGTPVASLASLITLKFYLRRKDARPGRYLAVFSAVNLLGLLILLAAARFL